MNSPQRFYGTTPTQQVSRKLARWLDELDEGTELRVAMARSCGDVGCAKVDAVLTVGQRGMQGVALLSEFEQLLAQTIPLATARLQGLGDLTTLSVGQIVTDTVDALRRL
ncbi:MAG TPA: hypothetical protein VJ851_04560 [Jatrophihabitans sp.]|nr:hypothetical protein [Jatrophihabitans sp.]